MDNLFDNIIQGATAGGMIGGAFDSLIPVKGDPMGIIASVGIKFCGTAVGTLIGATVGVVKTIVEEIEDKNLSQ